MQRESGGEEVTPATNPMRPHLGRLAALLLTGHQEPPVLRFVPGTLARLDRSTGWSVGYLVPPELTGPS